MNNARTFTAKPAMRAEEPLLLGVIGPPGGGKTLSSLKLAKGIQSVRGGDIVVIDTEAGRSRKYNDLVPFKIVEFEGQARSEDFLEAIKQQLSLNPAAIVVDSLSDEHESYLEWHDAEVPKFGGNEWAAWSKPKASRKRLISGILRIKTPLIFTFRAREKTQQNPNAKSAKDKIVNIGWQPVAPLEIVHTLDLTCILPPRADGVPVWKSDKIGEDFIIKLPNYLAPFITEGQALNENMGAAFARWAKGETASPSGRLATGAPSVSADPTGWAPTDAAGGPTQTAADYIDRWDAILEEAADAKELGALWNADHHKAVRRTIAWSDDELNQLKGRVSAKIKRLGDKAKEEADAKPDALG